MKKLKIVLDIDDTIFNLRHPMACALNQHTGQNIDSEDWVTYNMLAMYNISQEQLFDILISHKSLEQSMPEEGAHELINLIIKLNLRPVFVTHRGWHPNSEIITKHQISSRWPLLNYELISIHPSKSKVVEIVNRHIKPDLLFDDNPHVVSECYSFLPDCESFLIRQPHNRLEARPSFDLYWAARLIQERSRRH